MFGYVMPYKSELKMREYETFRAYYCGLCKTMGKEFNTAVRFGLNYDLAFLGILLSSLQPTKDQVVIEGCIAHPLKKKKIIVTNQSLIYTAHISIMLIYFKLLDDWKDNQSLSSLLASRAFLQPIKKAKALYPEKYEAIRIYLEKLSLLEKENCDRIDESADLFAKIMEEIAAAPFIEDANTLRILRWLGYHLGRWIYILDAFDDLKKDCKDKNYNPILLQYPYAEEEDIEDFISRVKASIEFTLTLSLDNMAKSYELLDPPYHRGILDNIFYMGTRFKMDQVLHGKEDKNFEKSI
ncbi:DUF5685 family protein [Irregularibacter muris]|uniref:DUF5685 family protein n=1 Tax=Irregularibacter muris TaxID=1796619 RepID=A0AAE3HE09_9FIRM|nr:DUF5685 family protein [Irregularibacter muris]MCR1898376.1 DUF5685 family protein [Irregularibacter muris]